MSLKEEISQKIAAYRKQIGGNLLEGVIFGIFAMLHLMNPWLGIALITLMLLGVLMNYMGIRKLRKILNSPLFYLLAVQHDLNG